MLAGIPWLLRASPATLDRFVAQGILRGFRRGEVICRQGERADALIVVLSGVIEVSTTAPSGNRHILTHLKTGRLLNVVPLLDGEATMYDAQARRPTSVLYVPAPVFRAASRRSRTKRPDPRHHIYLDGKRTSISLENEFSDAFLEIAAARRMSSGDLLSVAVAQVPTVNRSSAARIFALMHFRRLRTAAASSAGAPESLICCRLTSNGHTGKTSVPRKPCRLASDGEAAMRLIALVLVMVATPAPLALAQSADPKGINMRALGDRTVAPVAKPGGSTGGMKPCPEYGAGFYRLAGSDTCVRLGGSVGTDVGTSRR